MSLSSLLNSSLAPQEEILPRAKTHGTYNCYRAGCRCDDCIEANSEYKKRQYAAGARKRKEVALEKRRLNPPQSDIHGTYSCFKNSNCRCKLCQEARTNYNAEYFERNYIPHPKPRKPSKEYRLKHFYDLTLIEYEEIKKGQGGVCACCSKIPEEDLCVDHDHNTGELRGLLCHRCNSGIGLLGDYIEGVERAVSYLNRSQYGIWGYPT